MTTMNWTRRADCPEAILNGTGYGFLHTKALQPASRRKRCAYCGATLSVTDGTWAVMPWRRDGRYHAAQETIVATFRAEAAADDYATASGSDLVARWIDKEA